MESDLDWAIRIEALNSDCVLALQDYHRARVFLPKPTADKIQSLIVALRRRIIRHNSKAQNESLLKARVIFKELKHPDYNSLAEELASEFRSLLGVESDASPEK